MKKHRDSGELETRLRWGEGLPRATFARAMSPQSPDPTALLERTLESGRVHSSYLLSGPGAAPREAALHFVRGLVCTAESGPWPCEACSGCRRSSPGEPIEIDGTGKKGPMYRHVGDHPDLLWVEREQGGTRVRIGQVRALQDALRLGSHEGGRRAVVIADAEWLNQEGQNALLRLLEEPPPKTSLVLVTANSAGLLATIRSRCQIVRFPADASAELDPEEQELRDALDTRFDDIPRATLPDLLDWAEEFRGGRAEAAARVERLLAVGSDWLRARVKTAVAEGDPLVRRDLDAFQTLTACRKDLAQRNANPQMVAERALIAVRTGIAR